LTSNNGWATDGKVQRLRDQGFLKLEPTEAGIPPALITAAESYARALPPPKLKQNGWGEYPTDDPRARDTSILDLMTGDLKLGIDRILGTHGSRFQYDPQIAYQTVQGNRVARGPEYHLDGFYPVTDPYRPMSLLVGILLHDVEPHGGCFSFYPRNHIDIRDQMNASLTQSRRATLENIWKTWGDRTGAMSATGVAGTVFILSPLTIHGTLENTTNETRIMVFFRVRHPDLPDTVCDDHEIIGDPYPGSAGVAGRIDRQTLQDRTGVRTSASR